MCYLVSSKTTARLALLKQEETAFHVIANAAKQSLHCARGLFWQKTPRNDTKLRFTKFVKSVASIIKQETKFGRAVIKVQVIFLKTEGTPTQNWRQEGIH